MKQSPFESGRLLIDKSDCKTCHGIDKAINGPRVHGSLKRYSGKTRNRKNIGSKKVMVGGSGNWGERAMAAHPQLSEGEVLQMVRYILSLSGNNSNNDNNASSLSSLLSGIAEVKESPAMVICYQCQLYRQRKQRTIFDQSGQSFTQIQSINGRSNGRKIKRCIFCFQ